MGKSEGVKSWRKIFFPYFALMLCFFNYWLEWGKTHSFSYITMICYQFTWVIGCFWTLHTAVRSCWAGWGTSHQECAVESSCSGSSPGSFSGMLGSLGSTIGNKEQGYGERNNLKENESKPLSCSKEEFLNQCFLIPPKQSYSNLNTFFRTSGKISRECRRGHFTHSVCPSFVYLNADKLQHFNNISLVLNFPCTPCPLSLSW